MGRLLDRRGRCLEGSAHQAWAAPAGRQQDEFECRRWWRGISKHLWDAGLSPGPFCARDGLVVHKRDCVGFIRFFFPFLSFAFHGLDLFLWSSKKHGSLCARIAWHSGHWDGACLSHLHGAHGAWLDRGHGGYEFRGVHLHLRTYLIPSIAAGYLRGA